MNQSTSAPNLAVAQASIHQWQFEESLNAMRRHVSPSTLEMHWSTTGVPAIDATARAHIGEWQALDKGNTSWPPTNSVVDSIVARSLAGQSWDLYVVESNDDRTISVRRLRDQRGYRVRWLEGRVAPEVGTTVGLRLFHLEPLGIWASTLPLVVGDQGGPASLVLALLRSFGAHHLTSWRAFMAGPGGRIMLEYALSNLERRAADDPPCQQEAAESLVALHRSFSRLEKTLARGDELNCRQVRLDDGYIAWLEDAAAGPHLAIFDDKDAFQRYRHGLDRRSPPRDIDICQVRRATPQELSPMEYALGAIAGLRPARDGLVRLHRRNNLGNLVDPRPADYRLVASACAKMSSACGRRAA